MRILTLSLTNFQGIRYKELDFRGKSCAIYGDNGTGKTTIYNAITWLLFDKPSTGAKNWSPKTRGADGEKHNLEHNATATFVDKDGRHVTFGKTLKEVYKKKRGSMTSEYSGNTVDYFLDGVPVKEKEYTAAVAAQCGGDEMLKMLTMPDYFPEAMEWKKRRELLLEICGDVTDAQVIESSTDLGDLPGYLLKPGTTDQYYTVEEYSKIAKARKADINKQLETIPNRIDEVQRSIPTDVQDIAALERQLETTAQAANDIRQEIAGIQAGGAEAIQSELAAARAALAEAKANYTRKNAEAQADAYAAIKSLDGAVRDAERRAEDAKADAQVKRQQAARLGRLRESILEEYRDAQAIKWDDARETCPTCGRRLPETDIETMRADFNERRSEKLAAINERGRREASKDMIADLEAQAQALDEKASQAATEAAEAKKKLEAVERGIAKAPDFEETTAYLDAQAKIDRMQAAAGDVEASKAQAIAAADTRLQECLEIEHKIRGQIIQVEAAQKQRDRLAELEDQEKQLAAEYENVEHGVYLCELFTKTKVSLLTSRINAKFKGVSFQLFTEQVNGGLSECCEVLVPCDGAMVPYATANHAARVNAGLEICATIADHYGQEMPVIVDNAESVTKLIDTDGQVIRLVVSEADKNLRVEVVA